VAPSPARLSRNIFDPAIRSDEVLLTKWKHSRRVIGGDSKRLKPSSAPETTDGGKKEGEDSLKKVS